MPKLSLSSSIVPIALLCLIFFFISCKEEPSFKKNCANSEIDTEAVWLTDLISDLKTEDQEWNNLGEFSIDGVQYFIIGNCNPVINYAPSYVNCIGESVGRDFIAEELDKEGQIDMSQIFSRVSYVWCGDSCDC